MKIIVALLFMLAVMPGLIIMLATGCDDIYPKTTTVLVVVQQLDPV